jgi:flagellar hook-associated protein 2
MATVGINFGAASSGAGFDVTATVSSIVDNLKAVETPWTTQLANLKSQDTAFTSIGSDLGSLSTSLQALTDFQGVMASKLGSSSDTNILSLGSAGPTAVAGSHTIVVSQLAQSSSKYSSLLATSDLLTGALTIQVGPGPATTIPVVDGTSDTLATYSAAINLAGIGVRASIISDTTGSRLSLVSNTSGLAGQLTVTSGGTVPASTENGVTTPPVTYGQLTDTTSGGTVALNRGLDGQDAMLTVDGISVESASNTVNTVIQGVSFQILSADPSTNVQVQIANDNSAVKTSFAAVVNAYNAVVNDMRAQEGKDASGNPEPLYGNIVISQLQSSLSFALTSGAAAGSVNSLYQLGISINQDGTLKLDTAALDSQLSSNYSDVVDFLQNSGSFGQSFLTTLDRLGNQSPTGAITLALKADSNQEAVFNDNVTAEDALIAARKTTLTAQLTAANQILQAIPQQLDQVNQLYSAMTGYNTNSSH